MDSLLIKNVILDNKKINIFCQDGFIKEISTDESTADRILDGEGCLVHAPLINAHTHSAMTLFRGNGDDLPLMEWLTTRVWPYEREISRDEIYWGAKYAVLEMIKAGTVFFNDMYWDFHAVAEVVEEMGVRANIAAVLIDIMGDEAYRREQIKKNERLFQEAKEYSDHVKFTVSPHAIYTVSEESLRWSAEFSKEHNLVLHTHLSETEKEVKDCFDEYGCSPVEYVNKLGMISDRFVAAHTVWLSENDISILGEKRAVCVNNPVSNMKLAVNGVYPYHKLKNAGAITAIGTDGAGSNNNLDMFEEMKIAALIQKFNDNDQTSLPAIEALAMATDNPTRIFGLSDGKIAEGREADLILINLSQPEMNPPHSIPSHLVYSANGSVVDSTICAGRVLMEHRVVEGEEEIRAKVNESAKSLFARIDDK